MEDTNWHAVERAEGGRGRGSNLSKKNQEVPSQTLFAERASTGSRLTPSRFMDSGKRLISVG